MDSIKELLKIKIFADGADLNVMVKMASKSFISGFTTNPTLMRKVGITNYEKFAKDVLSEIQTKPISFEVFSDEIDEIKVQAEKIASWGNNVYVKIPITNTRGESMRPVIKYLSNIGIKLNVTALMTETQVEGILEALNPAIGSYISVFAGRIADTGRDPIPIMKKCLTILSENQKSELIWASPRELLNIFQANEIGCHVITATDGILDKLDLIGLDLHTLSLNTVKMFYEDAKKSAFYL